MAVVEAALSTKLIALYGRSGSGKSAVARHLVEQHAFTHCSTGQLCRAISRQLFGNETRSNLNTLSQKIREIDVNLWISAALLDAPPGPIVFDSIRYEEDAAYLRAREYKIWHVECPPDICLERLRLRGQSFNESDMLHKMEHSLVNYSFDMTIENGRRDLNSVLAEVDKALQP